MLKVKDTELLQENVIGLVAFAQKHEFLNLNGDSKSPVVREYVDIFTNGWNGRLTLSDLETLIKGTQAFVRLPVYTPKQAAAWLGAGMDHVRDAVWRNGKLRSMKPGHDRLITHAWLVQYRDSLGQ